MEQGQGARVRVYVTGSENWIECGEGDLFLHYQHSESVPQTFLKVVTTREQRRIVDEARLKKLRGALGREFLLFTPVDKNNAYERQSQSIIIWADKNREEDIALSFLSPARCESVWDSICQTIGRNNNEISLFTETQIEEIRPPAYETLGDFLARVRSDQHLMCAALTLKPADIFGALLDIFQRARTLQDAAVLQQCTELVVELLSLNDGIIVLELLSDRNYEFTFRSLENLPVPSTANHHLEFLSAFNSLTNPLAVSPALEERIRVLHRLLYLRDTFTIQFLPQENLFGFLIFKHYHELITQLLDMPDFPTLPELLPESEQTVGFLLELLSAVKCYFLNSQDDLKSLVLTRLNYELLVSSLFQRLKNTEALDLLTCIAQLEDQPFADLMQTREELPLQLATLCLADGLHPQVFILVRILAVDNRQAAMKNPRTEVCKCLSQKFMLHLLTSLREDSPAQLLIEAANFLKELSQISWETTVTLFESEPLLKLLASRQLFLKSKFHRLFVMKVVNAAVAGSGSKKDSFLVNTYIERGVFDNVCQTMFSAKGCLSDMLCQTFVLARELPDLQNYLKDRTRGCKKLRGTLRSLWREETGRGDEEGSGTTTCSGEEGPKRKLVRT